MFEFPTARAPFARAVLQEGLGNKEAHNQNGLGLRLLYSQFEYGNVTSRQQKYSGDWKNIGTLTVFFLGNTLKERQYLCQFSSALDCIVTGGLSVANTG
ncbi:hypothetical protein CDAR_412391 [Caerostris darwini]|uniref:Uncharacterized protein n=1 Tax=Caerostris darwini TaxID=1538125 RepID=A0AAV4T0J7_9ARAC|nr:hypothetical protein CDAR_412391 [Caerostris darwini]